MRNTVLKIATVIAITVTAGQAQAWTQEDTLMETAFVSRQVLSWVQLRESITKCEEDPSTNSSARNTCKSVARLSPYLVAAAVHFGVANILNAASRRAFQASTMTMGVDVENPNVTVAVNFKF